MNMEKFTTILKENTPDAPQSYYDRVEATLQMLHEQEKGAIHSNAFSSEGRFVSAGSEKSEEEHA